MIERCGGIRFAVEVLSWVGRDPCDPAERRWQDRRDPALQNFGFRRQDAYIGGMDMADRDIQLVRVAPRGRVYLLAFSDGYEIRATGQGIKRLGLVEGDRFSPETYGELKRVLERDWAVYTAESMLARRPLTVGLFYQRMRQKGIAEGLVREIAADFKAQGLLNDYEYAIGRGRSLMSRKPMGRGYLLAWLEKQLVPRAVAEKAAAEILADVDEVETAVTLLRKREAALAKFDLETARQKAYTYLLRRAISYGAAKQAFEQLFGKSTA